MVRIVCFHRFEADSREVRRWGTRKVTWEHNNILYIKTFWSEFRDDILQWLHRWWQLIGFTLARCRAISATKWNSPKWASSLKRKVSKNNTKAWHLRQICKPKTCLQGTQPLLLLELVYRCMRQRTGRLSLKQPLYYQWPQSLELSSYSGVHFSPPWMC